MSLGFSGTSVRSSPFEAGLMAVSSAANFGMVGNGRLIIVSLSQPPDPRSLGGFELRPLCAFETNDGLFDCGWSDTSAEILVSASGDGALRLHSLVEPGNRPIAAFLEHSAEAAGVGWNLVHKGTFASCSWDCTLKLWAPERAASLMTLAGHADAVHGVAWSPHHADQLLSASADGSVRMWDPKAGPEPMMAAQLRAEVLAVDWAKYDPHAFASCGADRLVALWDVRSLDKPVAMLAAHDSAVSCTRWSPHAPSVLMSASYDATVCLWDRAQAAHPLLARRTHHTDMVRAAEFSLFQPGLQLSCGWDNTLIATRIDAQPPAR